MEHFLGIFGKDQSIIFMEKINDDMAGYIEKRDFILNEMTIGFNDIYSPYNYLSVLAHEVSHEFQFFNHKEHLFKDLMEAEEFTDDLTFYLGFGIYTEKGKIATKITEEIIDLNTKKEITRTCKLGYLNKCYFSDLFYCSAKLNNDRLQNKINIEQNICIINKIETLLSTHKIYLDSCFHLINEIKSKKISKKDFSLIKNFYSEFNELSNREIITEAGDYKKHNLACNKKLFEIVRNKTNSLFEFYSKFNAIKNRNES